MHTQIRIRVRRHYEFPSEAAKIIPTCVYIRNDYPDITTGYENHARTRKNNEQVLKSTGRWFPVTRQAVSFRAGPLKLPICNIESGAKGIKYFRNTAG